MADYSTAIPAALSLAEFIMAQSKKNKANKMPYLAVDPLEYQNYGDLKRKQAMLESGAYFTPQREAIAQAGAQAQANVNTMTGGDIGATINAINKIYRSQAQALTGIQQEQSLESLKMEAMVSGIVSDMAQRRQQVTGWEKAQAMAEATQYKQDAMRIGMGALAKFGKSLIKDGQYGQDNTTLKASSGGLEGDYDIKNSDPFSLYGDSA